MLRGWKASAGGGLRFSEQPKAREQLGEQQKRAKRNAGAEAGGEKFRECWVAEHTPPGAIVRPPERTSVVVEMKLDRI
jgi:hypothetical protein